MPERIHVVCLDSPAPPDYGGAIDMFYKIKTLSELGSEVVLHYFDYKAGRNVDSVRSYCKQVYAYRRGHWTATLQLPYIVGSRVNEELVARLNEDRCPILLEGLHCSGIAPMIKDPERIIIRVHNDETRYYSELAKTERSSFKRLYYRRESKLLSRYQERLDKNLKLACLSQTDLDHFQQEYALKKAFLLPCFLPWQAVQNRMGAGSYCLYHGNLAVSENEATAVWLIENVFAKLDIPFVVAGRRISTRLFQLSKKYSVVRLVNDPPDDELRGLIADAHIHVLPSLNRTGIKLKLLNSLFNGRFCITNKAGVLGSGLEEQVLICNSPEEWMTMIGETMQREFTADDAEKRKSIEVLYSNSVNAAMLTAQWKHCQ